MYITGHEDVFEVESTSLSLSLLVLSPPLFICLSPVTYRTSLSQREVCDSKRRITRVFFNLCYFTQKVAIAF